MAMRMARVCRGYPLCRMQPAHDREHRSNLLGIEPASTSEDCSPPDLASAVRPAPETTSANCGKWRPCIGPTIGWELGA